MGQGAAHSLWGFAMDTSQSRKLLPLFPCSPLPPWGLLKGRWAWVVGGLFLPRALEGHQTVLLVTFPPIFSLTFTVPSCLLLSCQVYHPPHPSFLAPCPSRLPGDLFCFLFCFFFSFECLSLQVSVAGISPFRSQRLQCKFPFPLGKCTTLFWGVLGCFLFFRFFVLFFFAFFFPFYLEGMGGSGNREVGGGFCLFF